MYYGREYGRSGGGGMGFGFRGSSPEWPYVGRGRGGLPRCYAYAGYGSFAPGYGLGGFPPDPGSQMRTMGFYGAPYPPKPELQFLKDRAEMIRKELETIDSRIQELEVERAERGKQS